MAVLVVAAMVVVPGRAYGETVLDVYPDTYTPKNPVQDNITRLEVHKLEKGSRDPVKGAVLQVIKKDTGEVIQEWTSDGTENPHTIARNVDNNLQGALDVNVEYILREVSVPEGYEKAKDVVFVIRSDENFNTSGEILSGAENGNAESGQIRGSGPEQAFVISLFDEATVNVTDEERRRREAEKEKELEEQRQAETQKNTTTSSTTSSTTSTGALTKTGDDTNYTPVIVIAVIGVAVIVGAIIWRRKK
ncbi:MAG: hypothetical protein IKF78_15360 [Atopobiaceae bacterium]|nr:hypothetical protein [Atopobiaceae bacterium]